MSEIKTVSSNTFYQLVARFGTVFFTFLLSIVLTRQVSSQFWGEYSIALNYLALFYMLADFGMNIVVVKDFATDDRLIKEQFSKILGFKLILGIILSCIAVVSVKLLPYSYEVKSAIVSGALLILLFSLQNSLLIVFQSKLEYWKSAVSNISIGLLTFLFIYGYINYANNPLLTRVVGLTIVAYLVGLLISLGLTREHFYFRISSLFDWAFSKTLFSRSFFVGLTIVLNSFMFSGDKFILSLFRSDFEVGVYTLAYKLFELYLVVPTFMMNSFYPLLIKLRVRGYDLFLNKIKRIVILMLPLWVVSAAILSMLGIVFIPMVWGLEMSEVVRPFLILTFISLPFFITSPLTWVFYLENKQKALLKIYFIGFIANLIANLYFIPIYGYIASAYITGATELLVMLLLFYELRNLVKMKK